MSAIFLIIGTAWAKPVYDLRRGSEHWILRRESARVELSTTDATLSIPIDRCTRNDVEEFFGKVHENFQRLLSPSNKKIASDSGLVESGGETRVLREFALKPYSPEFFESLPARFTNLSISENAKCPRSFR